MKQFIDSKTKSNKCQCTFLCVCGQLFLSCARCEWAIPLFSSPSRNQVNTPQSKMVIFPFKYGKCKHKNIYTSVKLLSQREYTITKRKKLLPLCIQRAPVSTQSFFFLSFQPREVLGCNGPFFILRDGYWKYSISHSSIHIKQLNYLNSQTNLL